MDKRILFLIIGFQLTALGIFIYNKCAAGTKNVVVAYAITPEAKLGDSVVFADNTEGSQRRKWDFGDGEYSDRQTGAHYYMDPGHYRIKLTVYGSFGAKTDATKEIVIGAGAPLPVAPPALAEESIIAGPDNIAAGSSVNYECNIKAASYDWEIQDDPSYKAQKGSLATYSFHSAGKRVLVLRLHNPDKVSHKEIMVTAAISKPTPPTVPRHHVNRPSGNLPDLPTMKAQEIK